MGGARICDPWDSSPRALRTRLDRDVLSEPLIALLRCHGWEHIGDRVEYKTPVTDLPTQWRGPITWRAMSEIGEDVAADTLDRAGCGPEWEPEDTGRAVITRARADHDMTHSPDCVEVGFVDEQPVAVVIAQRELSSGWSTLSFMAVVPERRGEGLGAWVHQRGFEMIRQQGGELYHGGTSAGNTPMIALFERHGVQTRLRSERMEPHALIATFDTVTRAKNTQGT